MHAPRLGCPCGNWQALVVVNGDTHDYRGAIWQAKCPCGRAWTVEVAEDPDYSED